MRNWLTRAFGRQSTSADHHVRILADIGRLLRIVSEQRELDDRALRDRLVAAGVEPGHAWRLVTFVPLAFGRFIIEDMGVQAPPTYLRRDDRGRVARRRLRDESEFRAAADHQGDFQGRPGFNELAVRTAEVDATNNALKAGSKPEDLVLVETITFASPG